VQSQQKCKEASKEFPILTPQESQCNYSTIARYMPIGIGSKKDITISINKCECLH
jgi:hypothetical protein